MRSSGRLDRLSGQEYGPAGRGRNRSDTLKRDSGGAFFVAASKSPGIAGASTAAGWTLTFAGDRRGGLGRS